MLPDFLRYGPGLMAGAERMVGAVQGSALGTVGDASPVAALQRVRTVLITMRTMYSDRFCDVERTQVDFRQQNHRYANSQARTRYQQQVGVICWEDPSSSYAGRSESRF